jgi:hypothetical protein
MSACVSTAPTTKPIIPKRAAFHFPIMAITLANLDGHTKLVTFIHYSVHYDYHGRNGSGILQSSGIEHGVRMLATAYPAEEAFMGCLQSLL